MKSFKKKQADRRLQEQRDAEQRAIEAKAAKEAADYQAWCEEQDNKKAAEEARLLAEQRALQEASLHLEKLRRLEEQRKQAEWEEDERLRQIERDRNYQLYLESKQEAAQRDADRRAKQKLIDQQKEEQQEKLKIYQQLALRVATEIANQSRYDLTWQTFSTQPKIAILPMSEQKRLYQIALRIHQQRNAAFGPPPPPPPPPELPTGYSVWFDGSDTTTMQFTSNTVSEWDDKVGNIELNTTQYGNSNNITQGDSAVRFAENGLEATIIDGDATSYTDRGMTLFIVANIHSKDLSHPAIGDVAHLYGRQLSTVDAGASIGQWAINARSVDAAKNDQFTPRFQVQSGTNSGNNFSGGTIDTGSIFLVEFQVSKSNSTAEMNIITQQNGNSDAKHYHSGYSGMSAISNNNDKGDSGTLTWDISEVDSNPYDSDTSYFHIIHYPKILNKQETEGVYKYFNYYNKTNFQYTSSFL